MDNLTKLLNNQKISNIEYEYPEQVQSQLARIHGIILDIAKKYGEMYARTYFYDVEAHQALRESYMKEIAPLLEECRKLRTTSPQRIKLTLEPPYIKSL